MEALAAARAYLCHKAPYFSASVYGLVPKVLPNMLARGALGGFGVTKGMVLYMDPTFFLDFLESTVDPSLGLVERRKTLTAMRGGLLAHEIMHILRDIDRVEAMPNRELANIAFDIPINHDLEQAGFSLPPGGVFPRTFGFPEGLTGEQYYDLLMQNMPKVHQFCGGQFGQGASGEESAGGQGDGQGDKDGDSGGGASGGGSDGSHEHQDKRGPAAGRCGSCAGGAIDAGTEQQLDAEIGRSPADRNRLRDETLREIKNAASMGRGTVPSSLEELLKEKPGKSVVPWRLKLARIVRRATGRIVCGQADFSMRRPSKKSFTRGIIRPGMIERKVEVGFVEDSSGSMGAQQLLAARAEAAGVFKQLGISDAWFMDADAAVAAEPQRIRMRDVATLPVHGRGGTDFRPGIKRMRELKPKPDICIYLTDGDGTAPEYPPQDMEVVWCIVPTRNGRKPANWGHLVVVSDDQELREPYGG
jgi:predicted metal-dependent peptidase